MQWDVSIYLSLDSKWEPGLKKDLRVSRVGPRGSLNAFFLLPIRILSQRLAMRAQYNGQLYAAFGKDESLPKRNLLIIPQLVGP
ncbi:hypothetical protein DCAR_0101469 [Daucus carota subsp. sativus]|uniref:Uncharacterized protein n=1 Tax=Daucus carota subsp. sativus TaxID=79200 RepID=A0AAF1AJB0_DAUCS|nr:hypothetical protein DCAR_0101469 [Daucus carota subsp. sativus]